MKSRVLLAIKAAKENAAARGFQNSYTLDFQIQASVFACAVEEFSSGSGQVCPLRVFQAQAWNSLRRGIAGLWLSGISGVLSGLGIIVGFRGDKSDGCLYIAEGLAGGWLGQDFG